MSCDWTRVEISEVCDFIVDCVNKTAPRVDYRTPYKMIRTPNIRNGRVDLSDCRFVEEDTYQKWTRRAKVERNDVLLTREAPMGEVGLVDFDDTVFLGQRVMQYRVNKSLLSPRFLLYSFLSPDLQNQFKMHDGTGSVVSHIRVPDCSKFQLNLPPLEEQQKIVSILGCLDDKIKINTHINQTLEQVAQAMFKSWFVDFEPVKAKIAALKGGGTEEDGLIAAMQAISGKNKEQLARLSSEQPDQYKELRSTAELFPSAMQDSELGEIPEGWSVGNLHNVAELSSERVSVKELGTDNYVSTENMLENKKGVVNASSLPSSETVPKFCKGDTLVSNIRPYFKKVWLATKDGGRSPDVLGFKSIHINTAEYLFNILFQDQFFEYMMRTSKGAKMPRGDKKAIMSWQMVIPPIHLMQIFSGKFRKSYISINLMNDESEVLKKTRDILLPKLLSGEVIVSTERNEGG